MMKRLAILLLLGTLVAAASTADQPKRPRILGVAHMSLNVTDLAKSRAFYKNFLGYGEPYALKGDDGSDRVAFIKINENQYLELAPGAPKQDGHLNHISIYTDSAAQMRDYLASRGVKVPEKVGKGRIGNSNFNIVDPDGHTVEVVQYEPDSWTVKAKSKFLPETRIADRMYHVGVLVRHLEPSLEFYQGILGFSEFWRGSSTGKILSWVNVRVPDGQDYVELMLYSEPQSDAERGVKNHICLVVPDIEKAVATLKQRAAGVGYDRAIEIRTGKNGKRQANLYDPDGTRVEVMEPNTVDGKPVPSSTAPPPQ